MFKILLFKKEQELKFCYFHDHNKQYFGFKSIGYILLDKKLSLLHKIINSTIVYL